MRTHILAWLVPAILCACNAISQGTTHIQGTLEEGNAADFVAVQYWVAPSAQEPPKTLKVPVKGHRFEADVPNCITEFSAVEIDGNRVAFIADGSTLTIDPLTHQVASSDSLGVQSRHNAWRQVQLDWEHEHALLWDFLNDRRDSCEDISRDEKALEEQYRRGIQEMDRRAFLENTDNVIGAMALSSLADINPKAAFFLAPKLSDEMLGNSAVRALLPVLEARANTAIGDHFMDFEIDGVKLSDYVGRGKAILLVFWASWCEESQKEMPRLKRLYEEYRSHNFDIVSVAVDDNPASSLKAAREWGMEWPVIVNGRDVPQKTYGFSHIPEMILFGPDGTILQRNFWGYDDRILESVVRRYVD